MIIRTLSSVALLALCGCVSSLLQADDLARLQAALSFQVVESPDMTEFTKHWTLGSQSAWHETSGGRVLVVDAGTTEALSITGFQTDYGSVVATGWVEDKRFFIHVSKQTDSGTMIYFDLDKKVATEVEPWAAW